MNALSKITAFFIAILLLFIIPLLHNFERQDDLAKLNTQNAVTRFVDSVRNKGFITPKMFNEFVTELEQTKYVFDIEITHEKKIYFPIYTDPVDASTFTGEYMVDYQNYYSPQILKVLFPNNNQPLEHDSRVYKLAEGDFFKVEVKNKNKTNATILTEFLTFGNTSSNVIIHFPYGGMVHNEDY